ncbi:hypothetical protein HQ585_20265 [candidate division KSB1 bacterium]|nr:hypothetical protein [candidate division KSB1 bacterium]
MSAVALHAQVSADSLTAPQPSLIKSPRGAMLRSAVLPGWGQLYNNQKIKASIAVIAEVGLITNAVALNQQVVSAVTEDERLYYESNRSLSVWLAIGVYFLVMIDSYVDANLSDFDIGPDLSMLQVPDNGTGSLVSLSWSF